MHYSAHCMAVNVRLRVLRAERGLSQMHTAAHAKVDGKPMGLNRYWRIENGYSEPTPEEQAAIAAVFKVPTRDAFPEAVAS